MCHIPSKGRHDLVLGTDISVWKARHFEAREQGKCAYPHPYHCSLDWVVCHNIHWAKTMFHQHMGHPDGHTIRFWRCDKRVSSETKTPPRIGPFYSRLTSRGTLLRASRPEFHDQMCRSCQGSPRCDSCGVGGSLKRPTCIWTITPCIATCACREDIRDWDSCRPGDHPSHVAIHFFEPVFEKQVLISGADAGVRAFGGTAAVLALGAGPKGREHLQVQPPWSDYGACAG